MSEQSEQCELLICSSKYALRAKSSYPVYGTTLQKGSAHSECYQNESESFLRDMMIVVLQWLSSNPKHINKYIHIYMFK